MGHGGCDQLEFYAGSVACLNRTQGGGGVSLVLMRKGDVASQKKREVLDERSRAQR